MEEAVENLQRRSNYQSVSYEQVLSGGAPRSAAIASVCVVLAMEAGPPCGVPISITARFNWQNGRGNHMTMAQAREIEVYVQPIIGNRHAWNILTETGGRLERFEGTRRAADRRARALLPVRWRQYKEWLAAHMPNGGARLVVYDGVVSDGVRSIGRFPSNRIGYKVLRNAGFVHDPDSDTWK